MIGYVEAPRAWGYTRGMARLLGINLSDAVIEGWLSRAELATLVNRCSACGPTPACSDWLAHTVAAEVLPAYCPNRQALEALKP